MHARTAVEVSFTPHNEKDYSFRLKCKVKCKATPLVLKVTAEGYSINLGLSYTSPEGSEVKLPVGRSDERKIRFGQVQVNESALGQIFIFNHSLHAFEYRWLLTLQGRQVGVVNVEPGAGQVPPGGREVSQLKFSPGRKITLRDCQLTLSVSNNFRMQKFHVIVFKLTVPNQ